MKKTIAVGGEDFTALRKADSYYVDKTELLYELVQESNNSVTLFTRPRRFGKTLTMSMMESFFSIFKKDSTDVFAGLNIMNHPEFCEKWMNQYPVLFISFKDAEARNFELAYDMIQSIISQLCLKYSFLEDSDKVSNFDKEIFLKLSGQTGTESDLRNALKTIMRMMYAVYGKKVILLIDEYDVPLAKANANGYYREMLDLIRGIMSASLKTNEFLEFAIVTGCLRIPKESIFTGVNNFASYSVLDKRFSQYFGFTDEEVKQMLAAFNLSDKEELVQKWYDGYLFGDTKVYCPWDVVNYMAALNFDNNAKPKNYWENTSSNDAIKSFFDLPDIDVSEEFETLLNGGTITETVTNSLTYDQAYESEDNLWSILLMTGYVTPAEYDTSSSEDEGIQQTELRIPNREIAGIFRSAVVDHFNKTVDQKEIRNLMNALWSGDETSASTILSDLLWHTISYNDYKEDYYHAFLTGIFVGRGGYSVQSNKERGLGRPDIDLRDKKNRRAIIIEAKISENESRMEYWCKQALEQIDKNEYAKKLTGYREIYCYGISFYQKNALVRLKKL